MTDFNRHGLSRYVPSEIRLAVRQRCGFGCVCCGAGFYDYEHFDPDFKDATQHKAESITLLCMQCNQKKRRGLLSVETVRLANSNPRCLQQMFSSEAFDFSHEAPIEVVFAGQTFVDCKTLIEINELPLLAVAPPVTHGQPYRLSGYFADSGGELTLKIEENVWTAGDHNWDIEWEGQRVTIRSGPRDISLVLKHEPPHRLIIERLNMEADGILLRGKEDLLEVALDGIHWNQWSGCHTGRGLVGMSFANQPRRRTVSSLLNQT